MVLLTGLAFALAMLAGEPEPAASPAQRAWEFVGGMGAYRWVYVDPAHARDPNVMAEAITEMYSKFGRQRPMQIEFFDERAAVPMSLTYTPEQRRHRKAKFNFDPKTGLQRFVWLDLVVDPSDSTKSRFKETEEKLPLP